MPLDSLLMAQVNGSEAAVHPNFGLLLYPAKAVAASSAQGSDNKCQSSDHHSQVSLPSLPG